MTYILIGTGNMAWLMASRLSAAGHTCNGIWGRNKAAADELCRAFSMPQLANPGDANDSANACILALADSAIPQIVRTFSFQKTTLIHTAGSVPLDAIVHHSQHAGVIWPVYSIRKAALPAHRRFPVLIESNTEAASRVVREIAQAICDDSFEANSEQRQWLHLAAVMSNNFINHLLGIAADICDTQELPANLLQPLLEQTLSGLQHDQHPAELQTGPARRHDKRTMERHLSMLAAHPQWQILYETISQAIMKRFPLPRKG